MCTSKVSFSEAERPALGPKASLWSSSWCSSGSKAPPTQLRDVFREIDTDGSGTISTAELRRALEPHVAHRADSGGLEAGDRDAAQSLMEAADVSGDQQIDYREFIAATMQRQLYLREENVLKVFEHLDVDDSGDISVENLVALTGSKKKAEELIGEGDLDHSKTISYEEFKKLMHTAS